MRILRVRFKNLNSLVGEWDIDFSHPSFSPEGIVAITGPTGAGKSTILDAISLALYGRTPRLSRINKSANEIISRRTAECFSEVTFETQAGLFRCHWSQRRARKKNQGELQPPRHEIADPRSGDILDAGVTGVAARIEAVTGMDFDRFTRTMFLAQGSFAAFLLAAPDERAPILEQITGTDIYSRISRRVHERYADEQKKFAVLQDKLGGLRLLDGAEESRLRTELADREREDAGLAERILGANAEIARLEAIRGLEEELRSLALGQLELQKRVERFAPELERLTLANRALELAAGHSQLVLARRMRLEDRQRLAALTGRLEESERAVALAGQDCLACRTSLEKRLEEQRAALPVIRKARELDLQIREKELPIARSRKGIAEEEAALSKLRAEIQVGERERAAGQKRLEWLLGQMERNKADASLVEELAGIRERVEGLERLETRIGQKKREAAGAEKAAALLQKEWLEQNRALEARLKEKENLRLSLDVQQRSLVAALEGGTHAAWRDRLLMLGELSSLIERSGNALSSCRKSHRTLAEHTDLKTSLAAEATALRNRIPLEEKRCLLLAGNLGLLEQKLELERRIQSHAEARRQLQDGEPCPLCGSLEHPFARGNAPRPEHGREELAAARKELQDSRDALTGSRAALGAAEKALQRAEASAVEQGRLLKEELSHLGSLLENLSRTPFPMVRKKAAYEILPQGRGGMETDAAIENDADACPARVAEAARYLAGLTARGPLRLDMFTGTGRDHSSILELRLEDLRQECIAATEESALRISSSDALEKDLSASREALDKASHSVAVLEKKLADLVLRKELASQTFERLGRETAELDGQRESALEVLNRDLARHGEAALGEDLAAFVAGLAARRDHWLAWDKERLELERSMTALAGRIDLQSAQLRSTEEALKKSRAALADLVQEHEALIRERKSLLEGRAADAEEARHEKQVLEGRAALEAAEKRSSALLAALERLKGGIADLEKALAAGEKECAEQELLFSERLREKGFSDEEAFCSALLPEDARKAIADKARLLTDEGNRLASLEAEKGTLLEKKRKEAGAAAGPQTYEERKQSLNAFMERQKALHQEIGDIRGRLNANEAVRREQAEQYEAIAMQKRECGRWSLLHDIIGSADGKKYRNFAQGLTFELLVAHANRQLSKMTDRYLLVRDDARPLELNVIDNYQAGEIRTAKNLSGGESFIVSLALALGLSQMAGDNVRVDSLFLDEGFGSLDEDALETALETLSGLRQDGKLIVLISHVQALKNRIQAQIRVQPLSGGRSGISGPGCSAASEN